MLISNSRDSLRQGGTLSGRCLVSQLPGTRPDTRINHLSETLKAVDTQNGTVNFLEIGSGPTVLLVHDGAPGADSISCWYRCLDALAAEFRVLAVDMIGFGANARAPRSGFDFSHEARVVQLLEFLAVMEVGSVDVVGFSLGGAVALDLAMRRPAFVARIVAAAPAGLSMDIPEEIGPLMAYRGEAEQMRALLSALGGPAYSPDDELVHYRTRLSNRPDNATAWQQAMEIIASRGGLYLGASALSSIDRACLLVHGEYDPIVTPQVAAEFAGMVDGATIRQLPGCGHWIPYEAPDVFARLCLEHFAAGS
jgi:pimeloyl-ACP methyl ester carboxylesterase